MTMADIERLAYQGAELPSGMEYPEQVLFMELRLMYNAFNRKMITKETAVQEKKRIGEEYQCYKFNRELEKELIRQTNATELARAAYRKDRTLENADKLVAALEGAK